MQVQMKQMDRLRKIDLVQQDEVGIIRQSGEENEKKLQHW